MEADGKATVGHKQPNMSESIPPWTWLYTIHAIILTECKSSDPMADKTKRRLQEKLQTWNKGYADISTPWSQMWKDYFCVTTTSGSQTCCLQLDGAFVHTSSGFCCGNLRDHYLEASQMRRVKSWATSLLAVLQ